jgi:hypothetical protein
MIIDNEKWNMKGKRQRSWGGGWYEQKRNMRGRGKKEGK